MDNVQNSHTISQKGVSLVELSVVLVIIGLIIGAVAAGVTIRKSAELRSIITQVEQFRVATSGFDDKYDDLPGDMNDAHNYWGSDCDATASNCNGDADGDVEMGSGADNESFRFWQHLNLAGFIEGEYTGTGSGDDHIPYENCPATNRTGGGYHARTHTSDSNTIAQGTNVSVGGFSGNTWPNGKLLTPTEANYIDTKTDDGDPDDGKTHGRNSSAGGCITGTDPDRTYVRTEQDNRCVMFFDLE